MGFRNYEHRPIAYHLATPVSASEMRRRGWVVMARCQACQLDLRIDLDLMVRLNGPDLPVSAPGVFGADALHGHAAGPADRPVLAPGEAC